MGASRAAATSTSSGNDSPGSAGAFVSQQQERLAKLLVLLRAEAPPNVALEVGDDCAGSLEARMAALGVDNQLRAAVGGIRVG